MNSSTNDKVKGTAKEVVGKVKEKAGKAIGDPNLRDRGTAERFAGTVERKVGDVKSVFGKSAVLCIQKRLPGYPLGKTAKPLCGSHTLWHNWHGGSGAKVHCLARRPLTGSLSFLEIALREKAAANAQKHLNRETTTACSITAATLTTRKVWQIQHKVESIKP